MMATGTPPDIFAGNSTTTPSLEKHPVRCKRCHKWILSVDDEFIESDYAERVAFRCTKCGSDYTVADYRKR